MRTLICPISALRINETTARLTGFLMATLLALYLATGNLTFVLVSAADYYIRAFTALPASPASWLAA